MRAVAAILTIVIASSLSAHASPGPRELTFEDRVRAQEAIERVYYSHQIDATRPFADAVPRDLLERKVRTYLKQSVALDKLWHTAVTSEALERELKRMAEATRMPERLRELYSALGDDPFTIAECLARPLLVDRLTRNFFAYDETIHGVARRSAESLREALLDHRMDPDSLHPQRTVVVLARLHPELDGAPVSKASREGPARLDLPSDEFERWRAKLGATVGAIGPLVEERASFVVRLLLEENDDELRVATYTVPKEDWNVWWQRIEQTLDETSVGAVASGDDTLDELSTSPPAAPSIPDDSWIPTNATQLAPIGRPYHTAVWTGSVMIVWGGILDPYTNTGGRYDPATDTWTATSTVGAPAGRIAHTAVWTGTEMIVWGGDDGDVPLNSGGRYNPATDTWTPTTSVGAPTRRYYHSAVWTGSFMVVWGGTDGSLQLDTGGRYVPATDSWALTSNSNAPAGRSAHTSVWTGSRMVIWGGYGVGGFLNSGAQYDPSSNAWTPTSTASAPTGRTLHSAVWTGNQMIVWGGNTSDGATSTGGRYDSALDVWTAMASSDAARYRHAAVWTGSLMIVWGGWNGGSALDTGGRYDPTSNAWTLTSTVGDPSPRNSPTAVWTGSRMVVWGGIDQDPSGARYDPATDTWTPTSLGAGPSSRGDHTAVWTGSLMIVWGGSGLASSGYTNTGGRYDPATDEWTPTSTTSAPSARSQHTAIWTGSEMVVWGGFSGSSLNTGGRYVPVSDTWSSTSVAGPPSERTLHTAVWTGTRMIIWGGESGGTYKNSGAFYDPAPNSWTPISTTNAPAERRSHTAVWTGSRMIVWGGYNGAHLSTGGRYDPGSDTWTATTTTGAPSGRYDHTATWTGSRMIVWGGTSGVFLNSGGLYDPVADTWVATSMTGAPSVRDDHSALWAGSRMIVWGGYNGARLSTGGRYDPGTDTWTATSIVGAPTGRANHTAVSTGSTMIVWGGFDAIGGLQTGGIYGVCQSTDGDGDGYSPCDGDCNDGDNAIHPGAVEVCNGVDDNCDQAIDNVPVPTDRPNLLVGKAGTLTDLSWSPASGATGYDMVKGNLGPLRTSGGNFTTTTKACVANDLPATTVQDTEVPPPTGGLWFILRAVNCGGNGSYDEEPGGQQGSRDAEINGSANACP